MKADHKIYRIGPQATLALSKISTDTIQQNVNNVLIFLNLTSINEP